jgi:hypothetical protein
MPLRSIAGPVIFLVALPLLLFLASGKAKDRSAPGAERSLRYLLAGLTAALLAYLTQAIAFLW